MDQNTFDIFKKNLNEEICVHRERMTKILHEVGWEKTKTTPIEMGHCPINNHHYIPLTSMKKHIASCSAQNFPILTTREKLEAYEKALRNSSPSKIQDNEQLITNTALSTQKKGSVSFLEELQRQRDSKRRRVAYRKRGLHTGRKSRTEKMRDLVESIMESLTEERPAEES